MNIVTRYLVICTIQDALEALEDGSNTLEEFCDIMREIEYKFGGDQAQHELYAKSRSIGLQVYEAL